MSTPRKVISELSMELVKVPEFIAVVFIELITLVAEKEGGLVT